MDTLIGDRPVKTLAQMTEEVHQWCLTKGWHPSTNTFGDCMALLHSEVSEALEAFRDHGTEDATEVFDCDDPAHDSGECEAGHPLPKPEGVGSEFADVFIRLLDNCHMYGIDLQAEYERKMEYNKTRPHRHGGRAL